MNLCNTKNLCLPSDMRNLSRFAKKGNSVALFDAVIKKMLLNKYINKLKRESDCG